jgi:hypothetical protein
VALVVLVASGFAIASRPRAKAAPPAHCPGLDGPTGDGYALAPWAGKTATECVGWVVERDYPFGSTDPTVNAMVSKITAENRRVRDQATGANPKPYVRIGVFMPMTSRTGGAMAAGEILHSLQGSYAAQMQANADSSSELGDPTPLIQLVLANEATDESAWSTVVEQLGKLRDGAHPLVAVTGMGISVPETQLAGKRLSDLRIPSIGAVITADDMVAPWMFKVSPSNHHYAEALKAYLDRQRKVTTGYLIWDRNTDDNFVRLLKKAFTDTFDSTYNLAAHNGGFNGSKPPTAGTPALFAGIVRDICALNPDVVFYSGRDRDLPALVHALKGRGHCQNPVRPLVIAAGATGLTIARNDLDAAQVGVLDAACTDLTAWIAGAPATPPRYAAFHQFFVSPSPGGLGFTDDDLASGYALMHRDAVAAAIWAARRDAAAKADHNADRGSAPPISELPTAEDVRNALFSNEGDPIPAASGNIFFREQPVNDLWPVRKPVPVIRIGAQVAGWPAPDAWATP